MAEIVSLNQYRKSRRREKAAAQASQNRVRHGRTKLERQRDAADRDSQAKSQDGKRLEHPERSPGED
ncbi:MAG: DUF4169 family protein [Rhodospirillales bacterium]|nr:MAG: DUF4169 family protein [Rhodospirillales bacterium]